MFVLPLSNDNEGEECRAVVIVVEEMTGRTERDAKCTYWKHSLTATA